MNFDDITDSDREWATVCALRASAHEHQRDMCRAFSALLALSPHGAAWFVDGLIELTANLQRTVDCAKDERGWGDGR